MWSIENPHTFCFGRFWDISQAEAVEVVEEHTEFVYGLDYNLHIPGQMVDCGWDQLVHLYTPKSAHHLLR